MYWSVDEKKIKNYDMARDRRIIILKTELLNYKGQIAQWTGIYIQHNISLKDRMGNCKAELIYHVRLHYI